MSLVVEYEVEYVVVSKIQILVVVVKSSQHCRRGGIRSLLSSHTVLSILLNRMTRKHNISLQGSPKSFVRTTNALPRFPPLWKMHTPIVEDISRPFAPISTVPIVLVLVERRSQTRKFPPWIFVDGYVDAIHESSTH